MQFTSHPLLLGVFVFGVVWAMLHHYEGGGSSDDSYSGLGNDYRDREGHGQGDSDGGGDIGSSASSD